MPSKSRKVEFIVCGKAGNLIGLDKPKKAFPKIKLALEVAKRGRGVQYAVACSEAAAKQVVAALDSGAAVSDDNPLTGFDRFACSEDAKRVRSVLAAQGLAA